jgi:uncharacterized membrane protein YbhN (UPF0104 family)
VKGAVFAWLRTLGGVAILGLLIWRLGSGAFLDGLRGVNIWGVLGAFAIGVLATVTSAWRWCLAARGLGIKLSLRTATADYYQALFLNATLPGGLLGDVDRAVRNGKESGSVGRGVRAVMLERFAGQVVLFAVGAVVLVVRPEVPMPSVHPGVTALAVTLLVLVVGVPLGYRFRGPLLTVLGDVRRGLLSRRNLPWVALSSVLVLASHLATFVLAARVAGSSAPLGRLLPLMVLALLVMGLPLSIGGWGPREGFCAWAFGVAGLGATQGLEVAVVYGVFAFVASVPGIAVLAMRVFARRAAAAPTAIPTAIPAAAILEPALTTTLEPALATAEAGVDEVLAETTRLAEAAAFAELGELATVPVPAGAGTDGAALNGTGPAKELEPAAV